MHSGKTRISVSALIPAAGLGKRFGGPEPKQFLTVCGRPLLRWTVERLLASGLRDLTVAVPAEFVADAPRRIVAHPDVRWIAGGESRRESVAACLAASRGSAEDLVLVHDGARPVVAPEDVAATIEAAREAHGAILGRPLGDTLKRVEAGRVQGTVDRRSLFRAETPQVFRRGILARALEDSRRDEFEATDEAAMVERLADVEIRAVVARRPNPKLTEAGDLAVIEALLREAE